MAAIPYVYQPQTIEDPQDIGNNFPSGLCVGPNTINDTPYIPGQQVTLENALSYGYGNGLLIGPQCIYRINPAPPSNDNINAGIPFASGSVGQKIPFQLSTTSPRAVQLMRYTSGNDIIQFDYPRSGSVTLNLDIPSDAPPATTSSVTTTWRGVDVWGRKLTTTVTTTVSSSSQSCIVTSNTPSCLFQIYSVTVDAVTITDVGTSPTISIGAGNQFGLPYKLTDLGHVSNYSQWWVPFSGSTVHANSWTELSNTAVPYNFTYLYPSSLYVPYTIAFPSAIQTGYNKYAPVNAEADPSATSNDVRGYFTPQTFIQYLNDNSGSYAAANADSFQYAGPVTLSYYVPGADVFPWKYQQMMNELQQSAVLAGAVSATGWDGFGQTLYGQYTGEQNNNCKPTLDLLVGPKPYSDF